MSKISIFLLIFLLLILQLTIIPHLSIFNAYPNILWAGILALAIVSSGKSVLILALVTGTVLDFFSGLPFGINALSFVLVVWLVQFIGKNIFKMTELSGQVFLIGFACFSFGLINILIIKFFHWVGLSSFNLFFWSSLIRFGLPGFIANSLLTMGMLALIKKIYGQVVIPHLKFY